MVSSFANNQSKADSVGVMDPCDLLFMYCDVLEPSVVRDSWVSLLKIVPVEGKHGELVTRIFENVHFIRVQWKNYQTGEIYIRDRTGKQVEFEHGTVYVTLWSWKAEPCPCMLETLLKQVGQQALQSVICDNLRVYKNK